MHKLQTLSKLRFFSIISSHLDIDQRDIPTNNQLRKIIIYTHVLSTLSEKGAFFALQVASKQSFGIFINQEC